MTAWFFNRNRKNEHWRDGSAGIALPPLCTISSFAYYPSYGSLVYELTSFFAFSCRSEQYSGSAWLTKTKKIKMMNYFGNLERLMRKSSKWTLPFASGETTGLPISSSPETGNSALNSAPSSIFKLRLHGNKSCFSAYADLNIPISLRSLAFLRSAPWRLYFYFVFDFLYEILRRKNSLVMVSWCMCFSCLEVLF